MGSNNILNESFENSLIYELAAPKVLGVKELQINANSLDSNSVFAKTLFSAISTGTELAAWTGKPPLRPSIMYPRLVGYCNVAQVQAVGPAVNDLVVGDVILTHQSHRSSFCCNPQDVLLKTRDISQASQKRLATTYLYHLGYSSLLEGGYKPGSEVAIVGLGALGFACASLVSAYGGSPVVFSGRGTTSALLKHIPYAQSFNKNENRMPYPSTIGLDGADIVINTSDSWADYELSLNMVRRGGTVVLLGFPGRGMALPAFNPLDSKYVYDKTITIRQAGHVPDLNVLPIDLRFTLKRNLAHIFSLLESGRLDASPLAKTCYSWKSLQAAYEFLGDRPEDALSAVLDWSC